jgi:hypothetical protein
MRITSGGNTIINPVGGNGVYSQSLLTIKASVEDGNQIHMVQFNDDRGWRMKARSDGHFYLQSTHLGSDSNRLMVQYDTGNVGIGTTSPSELLDVRNSYREPTSGEFTQLLSSTTTQDAGRGGSLGFGGFTNGTSSYTTFSGIKGFKENGDGGNTAGALAFYTRVNGGAINERMRITSGGGLLINTTTDNGYKLDVSGQSIFTTTSSTTIAVRRNTTDGAVIAFYKDASVVGTISVTGSATAYNTSSDYRLKQDLKDFNGLDLLTKIKTYDYEWKADKTRSYGVIAHELQSVINYAVTGVKDGKEMQGVDYSKIVPVLIKAVQESHTIIKTLEERIVNLEHK